MAKRTTDWHHRKPRCLGGTRERRNLSRVDIKRHVEWTKISTCKTPEQIAKEINTVLFKNNKFRFVVIKKPEIEKPASRHSNQPRIIVFRHKPKIKLPEPYLEKKRSAWKSFSGNLTPEEFSKAEKLAREITDIWLDPDYEMRVEKI